MIGDNIKFYRKKNQLTQDDIAEACNVTRQAVSKWENGESLPTVDNLYALSRLLHTSVDDILIGEKERDDEPSLSFFLSYFSLVFLPF
ncbi:helix-turn-helix domain-containing protein [Agathobacter rectalis]|uniref:helix-turn-helix domain-containing protein n=1 Tax=Agathobacter rectalis TaxID=39491 RepID=UPI0027D21685|nr:helix-turn-helix transcriptional regulator [Agathobacter rectalis]